MKSVFALNSNAGCWDSLGISKLHLSFNMTDVHFPNRWQCRSYFSLSCLPLFSQLSLSVFALFRILQIKTIFRITSILKHFKSFSLIITLIWKSYLCNLLQLSPLWHWYPTIPHFAISSNSTSSLFWQVSCCLLSLLLPLCF